MFKMIGQVLLAPLFVVAFALRLALFLPFAALFLLPVLIMRPRLILRAPRMFKYMLMAKRDVGTGCGPGGRQRIDLEMVEEPLRI
ncbi:MAG: hypothetical protein O3B04_02535 [Chloroflexi bacterium]|nr:hypothetical protein [Chloroflexota bacterium]